jgi:hypothetical protein
VGGSHGVSRTRATTKVVARFHPSLFLSQPLLITLRPSARRRRREPRPAISTPTTNANGWCGPNANVSSDTKVKRPPTHALHHTANRQPTCRTTREGDKPKPDMSNNTKAQRGQRRRFEELEGVGITTEESKNTPNRGCRTQPKGVKTQRRVSNPTEVVDAQRRVSKPREVSNPTEGVEAQRRLSNPNGGCRSLTEGAEAQRRVSKPNGWCQNPTNGVEAQRRASTNGL